MQEQTRLAAARGDAAVTPLADLELRSFIDKDGKVASVDTKGVKASVFAVYDEVRNTPACAQVVQTQGVSCHKRFTIYIEFRFRFSIFRLALLGHPW